MISIDFDKAIDVTTLNSANFYLQSGAAIIPTDNPSTNSSLYTTLSPTLSRARLAVPAPNLLTVSTTYQVVVTTGVTDLSGNTLAAGFTWSFTTTATPNPTGPPDFLPSDPLTVYPVSNTNAFVFWGTNKPTNYVLRYGRGDSTANTEQDLGNYLAFHTVPLDPLAPGKRYWIQLNAADYADIFGATGLSSSGLFQFNTTTDDTLAGFTTVAGGTGNQGTIKALSQTSAAGAFVFWTDDTAAPDMQLHGQLFDNTPVAQWVAGGIPIFAQVGTVYSFQHAADDGAGGVILLASAGTGIYAKRLNSAGAFIDWEGVTTALTPGLQITASGTNGRAVPVNAGLDRVLYVWQNGANIDAVIWDNTGTPPVVRFSSSPFVVNGQNPFLIPDGTANGILIYTNGDKIYGQKIDGNGAIVPTWNGGALVPLTSHANNEVILDVQSDNAGGAVVLYRYNGNTLFAQRVNGTGLVQWGVDGRDLGVPAVSSQEVMACFGTPVTEVIAVANIGDDIWAARVGAAPIWAGYISNQANGGIQQNPKIFPNGVDTIITWEDDRFQISSVSVGYSHNTGWGIFGMKIDAATGVKDILWTANATGIGTDDYNGVAVMLNNAQSSNPKFRVAPYSGGGEALLIWEDLRYGQGTDVDFINLNLFSP
ncbi:MAG: hypothetical protein A2W19_02060 [Spirochaetes bacterium RBG_16_49_21]|nr:MAG: hypothetical protein A2W19_02060 [Spirochaetes bacterium RBG_16_49_21]